MQLALQLQPPRVPQRSRLQLEVRALHLATALEEPVDLGEGEQSHAVLGEIVGHGEQAGEETRVMACDQLGQPRIGTHGDQAEGDLEGTQGGGQLLRLQVGVAAGGVREAAPETRAFEARDGRCHERTREQRDQADDEHDGHREQHQRDEHGRHPRCSTLGQGRRRDKPCFQRSTR